MTIPGAKLETDQIKPFALAGNAILTLVSLATGTRFTFKIQANEARNTYFVKVLAGSNNEGDYRYIGFIREGRFVHGGRKSFAKNDAPSVIAVGWFVRQILYPAANGVPKVDKLEVWHEGHCGRCGRRLTVPESIATGLGPDCASKEGSGPLLSARAKTPKAPAVKKAKPSFKELVKSGAFARSAAAPRIPTDAELARTGRDIELAEYAMQQMEADGDRENTEREERAKFAARSAMESTK